MKSFKSTAWILPQPVLIIGTYDKNGKPNAMNAAWGGQWDMHEIIISLGSHQTTDNLADNPYFTVAFATTETLVASDYVGIVSGKVWIVSKVVGRLMRTKRDDNLMHIPLAAPSSVHGIGFAVFVVSANNQHGLWKYPRC